MEETTYNQTVKRMERDLRHYSDIIETNAARYNRVVGRLNDLVKEHEVEEMIEEYEDALEALNEQEEMIEDEKSWIVNFINSLTHVERDDDDI